MKFTVSPERAVKVGIQDDKLVVMIEAQIVKSADDMIHVVETHSKYSVVYAIPRKEFPNWLFFPGVEDFVAWREEHIEE